MYSICILLFVLNIIPIVRRNFILKHSFASKFLLRVLPPWAPCQPSPQRAPAHPPRGGKSVVGDLSWQLVHLLVIHLIAYLNTY